MNELFKIFEDDSILILDKPSGVVVNRSDTHFGATVQDYVEEQVDFTDDDPEQESEFKSRSGVVHRLDKDTSGILLVAKTPEAFADLQRQFKERNVKKEYNAVVLGKSPEGLFEINAPLARNPKNRLTMAVVVGGKEARTDFEFVKAFEIGDRVYSYLKAFPLTGRTHQIRIHLASLNLPIAADQIYCTRTQLEVTSQAFARMMLHALSIEFTHPVTGKALKFESKLPEEFKKIH